MVDTIPATAIFANAGEHLLAELQPLRLLLQRQALRLRAAGLLAEDAFRGLYIPDAEIDALLRNDAGGALLPFDWNGESRNSTLLAELTAQLRAENEEMAAASVRAGVDLPLVRLARRCSLSRDEADALLICAAPELDLGYETLYAYVQNDITKKHPTVDLVLALLSPDWEGRMACRPIFAEDRPLLRYGLVRFMDDPQERDPSSLGRFLKVDERVVNELLGDGAIDRRLLPFTGVAEPACAPEDDALPEPIRARLLRAARSFRPGEVIVTVTGTDERTRRSAVELVCAEYGLRLVHCDLGRAREAEDQIDALASRLVREAVLRHAGVYLHGFEGVEAADRNVVRQAAAVVRAFAGCGLPLFLAGELEGEDPGPTVRIDIPLPDAALRRRLWARALRLDGEPSPADLVAETFTLTAGQIERAAEGARRHALLEGRSAVTQEDLRRAAREQSHSGLRRLAQKIDPRYGWEDIILPPRTMRQLREVRASIAHRHAVYVGWGFARKLSLGRGINVLFYGPSGAGKTMAAQVLAHELGLDLYRIDLSMVVSKYIGETEKNLGTIFREARTSNAILFFDEADALFGKRSEVKDAHDRYANIEVAYLLQQMEEYDGTVVLATNLSKNLDDAFARRMHHTVEFPFPDAAYRERIWHAVFPPEAPLAEDIDVPFLARQFELAGGNIRNVALAAAFMAAEGGGPIEMAHLIGGTARELQKMGKLPSQSDFQGYYALIRRQG